MVQNKYTKMATVALIVASVLGGIVFGSLYGIVTSSTDLGLFGWLLALLVLLGVVINLFVAYKIHKGSFKFIRFIFWLYILQIFGFETPNYAFSFTTGFSFNVTWSVYEVSMIFDLFAIIMSVILYKAMRSDHET